MSEFGSGGGMGQMVEGDTDPTREEMRRSGLLAELNRPINYLKSNDGFFAVETDGSGIETTGQIKFRQTESGTAEANALCLMLQQAGLVASQEGQSVTVMMPSESGNTDADQYAKATHGFDKFRVFQQWLAENYRGAKTEN